MSEVKRWAHTVTWEGLQISAAYMAINDGGEYVMHADYAALEAERDALHAEAEALRAQRDKMAQILRDLVPGCKWRFMRPRIDQALQEVDGGN